ncbi:MAG: hypothetical protein Q4Q53_04360 [Methanocorpusculum sp.]|nr:hypothetical protein [Methanocorpusculum sp.]
MSELPSVGQHVDIIALKDIRDREKINIYLYMDETIARNSSVKADIEKYRLTDLDFRPVLEINDWLKNMQKQMKQIAGASADIIQMLKEQPLAAEIIEEGVLQIPAGERKYLKCILPYLDEMEEIEVKEATGFKNKN